VKIGIVRGGIVGAGIAGNPERAGRGPSRAGPAFSNFFST
jgi:hypothetical protein